MENYKRRDIKRGKFSSGDIVRHKVIEGDFVVLWATYSLFTKKIFRVIVRDNNGKEKEFLPEELMQNKEAHK